MTLDNLIMIPGSDEGIEFAAARNKPRPIFRYPSGLGPKDREIQASLTLNQPGNSGKYECVFQISATIWSSNILYLGDPIVIQDEDTDSSGNNISEEQEGPLNTPSTSVAGSEAGCDPALLFHEFPC